MKCEDCLYEKICSMREISNDIKEEIKEFGCMNFIACADVREVKDDWEWKHLWKRFDFCDDPKSIKRETVL